LVRFSVTTQTPGLFINRHASVLFIHEPYYKGKIEKLQPLQLFLLTNGTDCIYNKGIVFYVTAAVPGRSAAEKRKRKWNGEWTDD
jgi:hypothetical protein